MISSPAPPSLHIRPTFQYLFLMSTCSVPPIPPSSTLQRQPGTPQLPQSSVLLYTIHGSSASTRLLPILKSLTTPTQTCIQMSEIDQSDYQSDYQPDNLNMGKQNVTKMIWSNSRRKDATNHLPNSAILDSKWTLGETGMMSHEMNRHLTCRHIINAFAFIRNLSQP